MIQKVHSVGAEGIHTLVRKGLDKDAPGAYTILDQFSWEPSDIEAVMVDISDGMDQAEAAEKWIAPIMIRWQNGRTVPKQEKGKKLILSMLPGTRR